MSVNLSILEKFYPVNGVRIGTANAGIKQTQRPDIVVFELADTAEVAGVFTLNAFCAAPVQISKNHLKQGKPKYLLINTGNANAGTGKLGYEDALKTCRSLADLKAVDITDVLPFSTGVIGERLPVSKLELALPIAIEDLSGNNWFNASRGIMTTDTQPKGYSVQFEYLNEIITISGISKGAGMIMPNMATMLGFIATDAAVSADMLQLMCTELANKSFNRITIDGDTSTNDSCMLMASGVCSLPKLTDESDPFYGVLKEQLQNAFSYLAQAIVRDGEGATKFVSINVTDCLSPQEALDVAYTVAHSPLVKTALFASDANWGRILAAVGRSGLKNMDIEAIQIYLDDVCIVENGARCETYTEQKGATVMAQQELSINISMGRGEFNETIWTTDLSHEYVTINANYRS